MCGGAYLQFLGAAVKVLLGDPISQTHPTDPHPARENEPRADDKTGVFLQSR